MEVRESTASLQLAQQSVDDRLMEPPPDPHPSELHSRLKEILDGQSETNTTVRTELRETERKTVAEINRANSFALSAASTWRRRLTAARFASFLTRYGGLLLIAALVLTILTMAVLLIPTANAWFMRAMDPLLNLFRLSPNGQIP